jgi:hypothetical protein
MKRFSLVFLLLGLSLAAHADSLRSQVEAGNKTIDAMMMNRDINGFVKAMKSSITKDFKYSERGRASSFDQMVAGMRMGFVMMKKITVAQSKIGTLTEKGNTASGTTGHNMVGITSGQDHKTHKMVFAGTSVETYRKEKGKWLMSSMSWKVQTMTLDGKKIGA